MKKYVIKITQIDLENGGIQLFYFGKDGYVHDDPNYATGWKARRFAEDYIKRDVKSAWRRPIGVGKLAENNCIENERWLNHYDILEVEQEND